VCQSPLCLNTVSQSISYNFCLVSRILNNQRALCLDAEKEICDVHKENPNYYTCKGAFGRVCPLCELNDLVLALPLSLASELRKLLEQAASFRV